MSEQARACAAYLKDHPGYKRIMQELLKKYRSYGRPAGIVRLDDATQEECAAARGIFGILRRNNSAACYFMPNHRNNATRVPLFSGEKGPAGDEPFISIIIPFLLEIYLGEENQDTIRLQTRNKSYRQEINRGEAVIICN